MSVLKRAHKLTRAVWERCSADNGDTVESLSTYMDVPTGTLKGWLGNAPNRHAPIAVVMALAEQNDPAVVWGPFVGADHIVVRRPATSSDAHATDLVTTTLGINALAGELSGQVMAAAADGEIDAKEADDLELTLMAHREQVDRMIATVREQRRVRAVS